MICSVPLKKKKTYQHEHKLTISLSVLACLPAFLFPSLDFKNILWIFMLPFHRQRYSLGLRIGVANENINSLYSLSLFSSFLHISFFTS